MSRIMQRGMLVLAIALSTAMVGCNDPKNTGRDDQTTQSLNDRIAELEKQLTDAEAIHRADQSQIDALKAELDRLRAQAGTAPSGWKAVPGGAMTSIEGTVLFDSGKADLKPSAKKVLAQVAAAIQKQFPDREIYVFGNTDSDPIKVSKWKDNYELSCQRALSVVRYLKADGVDNTTAACGWGENKPAVGAADGAEAKQANRRVDIFAMDAK